MDSQAKEDLGVPGRATQHQNIVRGLAFQNLRTAIFVNSDQNLIEGCWFGLNDDGTLPLLRNINNPQEGSGSDGVVLSTGADHNEIRNNYFLGLNGVAAALRGNFNYFHHNYVGTRADGRVTGKVTDPALIGSPVDWLGGSGISITGNDHRVEENVIAGIRIHVSQWSLQADAIRVSGRRHVVRDNRIGLDGAGASIGVCGRGIYLSDGPGDLKIENNRIVFPELSAISLNGSLYNGNTLRGNVIRKNGNWRQVDGMANPEDAIQVGKSLPLAFLNFKPARVTSIVGTSVKGTNGDGSACPGGVIELFLDTGNPVEARQSLAVVTADAQGNWSATLPQPLAAGEGIRTTSTTAQWGTIANMSAGTTTGLSELYLPTAPKIAVEQPAGTGLSAGVSAINYGGVVRGKTSNRTFTIRNTGSAPLTGILVRRQGSHPGDFVAAGPASTTVAPGASLTFVVTFKPLAVGTRQAVLQILSNDADKSPFDIKLSGTGIAPVARIAVEQPLRSGLIAGKSKRSFGTVKVGRAGVAKTFTIKNVGTANLTGIKVSGTGKHLRDFTIGKSGKRVLPPGASTTFKVVFKPKATGNRNATIRIQSNDKKKNPFDIKISGFGAKP
jgi:hypothetical protein